MIVLAILALCLGAVTYALLAARRRGQRSAHAMALQVASRRRWSDLMDGTAATKGPAPIPEESYAQFRERKLP